MRWWSELGAGRLDVVIRGAGVLVVAGVLAGGGAYVIGDGGGVEGEAHAFVNTDVGGDTCTRSSTPITFEEAESNGWLCGSYDAAYDAANASAEASTVLIKEGTYGSQSFTGNRTSTNRITFDVAPGETVTLSATSSVNIGIGPEGSEPAQGPDYLTVKNIVMDTWTQDGGTDNRSGVFVQPGSSFIRIEDAIIGGSYTASAHDIEWVGGVYGACYAPPRDFYDPDPEPDGYCPINYVDHSTCEGFHADCQPPADILFEGILFKKYTYGPGGGCVAQGENDPPYPGPGDPDGCHHRSMYINGVNGLTLRGNTFQYSVFQPWTTQSGSAAGTSGNTNLLIENNEFAQGDTFAPGGYGWAFAWCQNGFYDNVIIRFNSFAKTSAIGMPDTVSGGGTCDASDFKIYGNIVGKDQCTVTGPGTNNPVNIVWRHNVFAGNATSGTCGTGDVNEGGTTMPWYTNDTLQPDPGDFALTGATDAPDNLVPADDEDYPCPETDYDGTPRPSGAGQFCDAGAHER